MNLSFGDDGYGVKTIPGIRESVEEEAWDEMQYYITVVSEALEKLVTRVGEARGALDSLLP